MTITGLMIYAMAVSLLLASGAWLLERGLRRLGVQTRWVWLGALALSLTLPASTVLRSPEAVPAGSSVVADITMVAAPEAVPAATSETSGLADAVVGAVSWVMDSLDRVLAFSAVLLPVGSAAEVWIVGSWAFVSLLLALLVFTSLTSVTRRARAGSREDVLGRQVRITRALGPATLGLVTPEIVLPRWAAELPSTELEVVLAHEGEHARWRDPLLLLLAALPVIALPWNPMVWWQLGRLRDAVELDCDRRVLRAGVPASKYGDVLLKLRAQSSGAVLLAPTMASSPSLLERRLTAMRGTKVKNLMPRTVASSVGALVLVIVACNTEPPSATEQLSVVEAGPEEEFVRLYVSGGRSIYVNDLRYAMGDLPDVMEAIAETATSPLVASVVADRDVPYRILDEVQLVLRSAGIVRVVFAASSSRESIPTDVETLLDQGLAIVLPEAGEGALVSQRNLLHLTVQPNGTVDVRRGESTQVQQYGPAAIERLWRQGVANNPNLIAAVKIHPEADHIHMLAVLDALHEASAQRISLQVLTEPRS